MAAKKQPPKRVQRNPQQFADAASDASTAVRQAASVLESELASGLAGVRKLETRFTKERRVDQKEFDEVLHRFRANAHEFIDVAAARMADLRSPDVQDLSQRLTTDAHDLFDTMINMLGMAPDIINRLAARGESVVPEPSTAAKPRAKSANTRTRSRPQASK